jgi:hypothetical protein
MIRFVDAFRGTDIDAKTMKTPIPVMSAQAAAQRYALSISVS